MGGEKGKRTAMRGGLEKEGNRGGTFNRGAERNRVRITKGREMMPTDGEKDQAP